MNKKEQYELDFWKEHGFHNYGVEFYIKKHDGRLNEFNELYKLPDNPDRSLEIGCGPFGGMSMSYGAKEWTLLDPLADEYLKVVTTEHEFISSGIEEMPLDDDSFDVIFCCNALDHADDYVMGIKEMHRVIKKDGLLCVLVHCRKREEINDGHPHSFSYDDIKKHFTDSGFSFVGINEYHDCYDTLMSVLRKD